MTLKKLEQEYLQAKENYRDALAKVGQLEKRIDAVRSKIERLLGDHRQATERKKFFIENVVSGHGAEADLMNARQALASVDANLENAREELKAAEDMHEHLRDELGSSLFNRRNTTKAKLFGAIAIERSQVAVEKNLDEMAEAFAAWCERSSYVSDIDAALRKFLFDCYAPVIGPRMQQASQRLAKKYPDPAE